MPVKKKSLGKFRAGRFVWYSSYGGFGGISHYYGKVISVDVERSVVVWLCPIPAFGGPIETEYPPPRRDEPSSWKFEVVLKKDVPRAWLKEL